MFLLFQAGPDSPIRSAMLRSEPALPDIQIMRRTDAGEGLDLVIAAGRSRHSVRENIGLFLQDRRNSARIYTLAIRKAEGVDCTSQVERATATDAVLGCTGDADRQPYWKFIYDVRSKALVRQFHYDSFSAYRVLPAGDGAVFIASDNDKLLVIEYRAGRTPLFRILSDAAARPWIERVHVSVGTVGFEQRRVISIDPDKKALPAALASLTQSTYDQFAAARPERVKNGYVRQGTEIHESVGPWQREGEKIWFGKTFYDGEGSTGVGGFGYFDMATRKVRMFAPPEAVDWSTTAVLVRPDAVWMGTAMNGEGIGGGGGGVLRFDRSTEATRRLKCPDLVNAMTYAGNTILIASDFGFGVVESGVIRRYFVDKSADGSYRVVEAK
jgi:hypothetical protein